MSLEKQFSPSAARNSEPILAALREILPQSGTMLEANSGTGQHAVHFAAGLPDWIWQPSDIDPTALASIQAYVAAAALPNLRAHIALDVTAEKWPISSADAVFSANMIHIAPWEACAGLYAGAGRVLAQNGMLLIYGPFFFAGQKPVPSNVAFDESLRQQNPSWGIRQVTELDDLASLHRLRRTQTIAMPANNHILVYTKAG